MYIGELIKLYRKQHGLSMQDFANSSGISKAYIGLLEKVYNPSTKEPIAPSLPKIQAIAKAMGMELDDLLHQLDSNQPVIVNTKSNTSDLPPEGYYNDPEVAAIAEQLRTNPNGRILFDASKNLTKDDIDVVLTVIKGLKAKEGKND